MTAKDIQHFSLCFIYDEERILLGMKKRGFGTGKWNGFGGKVEQGELPAQAVVRELREEAGLSATRVTQCALFDFVAESDGTILRVYVFRVDAYTGTPAESDEMRPQWFMRGEIPYDGMWADDRFWLPRILAGEQLRGTFFFDHLDDETAEVLRYELEATMFP